MPSGPRKRKAAKRKMESLGLIRSNNGDDTSTPPTTLLSPGNGSESGGEVASPTTPGGGRFEGEVFESDRNSAAMEGSDSGGEKLAGDGTVIPHEVLSSSSSSSAAADEVPVSQSEDVGVEQVKIEKGVDISDPDVKPDMGFESIESGEGLEMINSEVDPNEIAEVREGEQATPVSKSELTDVVEQPLPTSLEEAVAEAGKFGDVPVEKVERSRSVESPSNGKEEKIVSSSDTSVAQASDGGEQQLHAESQEIRNEVVATPPTGHQPFWMNCCGLLDLITGSHR